MCTCLGCNNQKSEHRPLDFVHALYNRPTYDRAYEGYISPMPSQAYWRKTGHVPIKPPVYRIQPGRPKLSRNREADEIPKGATKLKRYGIVITCRNCGQEGHNFAGCPQLRQVLIVLNLFVYIFPFVENGYVNM